MIVWLKLGGSGLPCRIVRAVRVRKLIRIKLVHLFLEKESPEATNPEYAPQKGGSTDGVARVLIWTDVNTPTLEVNVLLSCVRNLFGDNKTECSRRPVPLHPLVFAALLEWKEESLYQTDADFLFPSIRLNGTKPLSPDSLLKRSIRPALQRACIVKKQIGWHNFRHSLATNLRAMGVDIKVAQELLWHANSPTTLDIYPRAVSQQKRDANTRLVEMLLLMGMKKPQHPRRFWRLLGDNANLFICKVILVDLIGIEPMTSSMP